MKTKNLGYTISFSAQIVWFLHIIYSTPHGLLWLTFCVFGRSCWVESHTWLWNWSGRMMNINSPFVVEAIRSSLEKTWDPSMHIKYFYWLSNYDPFKWKCRKENNIVTHLHNKIFFTVLIKCTNLMTKRTNCSILNFSQQNHLIIWSHIFKFSTLCQ